MDCRCLVPLMLLTLGACASVETVPPKLEAGRTVGIISAIGDELTLTPSGLTGANGAERAFSIEPWGIDDLIISRASAALSARFQVRPVSYRRAAFAARDRTSPIAVANLLRGDPVKQLVRTEVPAPGVDVLVVVTKASSPYGSRGAPVRGVGIVNKVAVLGSSAVLHALYMIRVIDAHSFEVTGRKSAAPFDGTSTIRLPGPSRMIETALVPSSDDVASNEALKAAVIDLIERSLEPTLRDLGLTGP